MSEETVVAVQSVRLKGVCFAAGKLGVNANHLRLVCMGERRSDSLLERVRVSFPGLLAPGGVTWNEHFGLPTWKDQAGK